MLGTENAVGGVGPWLCMPSCLINETAYSTGFIECVSSKQVCLSFRNKTTM